MSISSNQYAAKIFSEHPIALWPLDDNVCYLSLIENNQRDITDITKWNLTLCSTGSSPSLPNQPSPFKSEEYYEIVGDAPSINSNGMNIVLENQGIFSFSKTSEKLDSFSINFYLYQDCVYVNYYEFGFRYWDDSSSSFKEILVQQQASNRKWINVSHTFSIEEFDTDLCDFIFKINVDSGGSGNDYYFIMQGLSMGQWSEPFSSFSLGSIDSALPASANLNTLTGISADQYGPLSENSYYIVENNVLLARSEGVPMVYGSENVVRLYSTQSSNPSFIFPGQGMFSHSGKYSTNSLEFWMRIRPNTKQEYKILGPIESNDGLYVVEGFITLVIGNKFQSHNVSQWYRPMLVSIVYDVVYASVFINGEEVIRLDLSEQDINFNTNEWWGFYCYENFDIFEIDCVSIYPYAIPIQVAKKRFVWGQGVESEETLDASFKGFSTSMSFPNSNYSVNAIYPDKERWDAGNYVNLVVNSLSISVPQYSLPEIFINQRDISAWYSANKKVNDIEYPSGNHPKFITFRPNMNESETEWTVDGPDWNEKSYLEFSNSNLFSSPFSSIYGIFELEDSVSETRPLIHIVNSLNGKRLEINVSSENISYSFDGTEFYSTDISSQPHVVVGLYIPSLIESLGYDIASFFSSYESLRVYVGGSPDTTFQTFNTFEGKIYKIAFSDSTSFSELSSHFTSMGIANYEDDDLFLEHYATYAVLPFYKYGHFFLDISISSYWEEYIPLSYFSKYISDLRGIQYYGFDFLQFNIGYPSIIERVESSFQGSAWSNYNNFENSFSYPVQKSYEILDNENITLYSNYYDLENNLITEINLDTSKSSVNIYATFQLLSENVDEPIENFTYFKQLTDSFVVDASLENTSVNPYKAYKTKFRIIDGTIIYPPKNINIEDVAIVLHLSIQQEAILSHPLKIRDMEIVSKALNATGPNSIGTKFGKSIYPYTKTGIYYNYKEKNPVEIYKSNTPYLYLTEKSGIRVLQFNSFDKEYGVAVPINESSQDNFYVGGVQLFIKDEIHEIVTVPYPIFEIQHKDRTIEFVVDLDSSGLRRKISCRDKNTKEIFENVSFYQNGRRVKNPYLIRSQWNIVSMAFEDPLNFSNFVGAINIFAGCTFNNISYYLSEGLDEISTIVPKTWQNIWKPNGIDIVDWQYWYDEGGLVPVKKWKNVYVFAEDKVYSLTPEDIFKVYAGTNINVIDDNSGIIVENTDIAVSAFSQMSWSLISGKPA